VINVEIAIIKIHYYQKILAEPIVLATTVEYLYPDEGGKRFDETTMKKKNYDKNNN